MSCSVRSLKRKVFSSGITDIGEQFEVLRKVDYCGIGSIIRF